MSLLFKALILGFLTGILGLGLGLAPFGLHLEENVGLDFLFSLRGRRQPPPDVVIVATDRKSAEALHVPSEPRKWPRSLHARLTENLAKSGASVIAFDLSFDEPRSSEEDDLFAGAIRRARNVVLCEYLKKEQVLVSGKTGSPSGALEIERLLPPIPSLAKSAVGLAAFPLPKVPVKVSQYWTFKTESGDSPTLPVVAFQVFTLSIYDEFLDLMNQVTQSRFTARLPNKDALVNSRNVEHFIQEIRGIFENEPSLAERMMTELQKKADSPADHGRVQLLRSLVQMYHAGPSPYLNFYGPPGTITALPYSEVLQLMEKPTAKEKRLDFNGKAVFIGLIESLPSEQRDAFHTALSDSSGLDISGVEMAATAFSNLLEDRPVQPLGSWAHLVLILLWGFVIAMLCLLLPTYTAAISASGLAIVYLLIVAYEFKSTGTWYPLIVPLLVQSPVAFLGAVVWKSLEWNRERQNIAIALRRYLPERVVDQLAKNVRNLGKIKQLVYGICLYTDAAQYTTLSETMDPEELSRFMNSYYEILFKPIKQYGGVVSDIVGDSMLAIWVTEKPDLNYRKKACLAALDIARAVDQFNQSSGKLKLPTRIGLHSGYVLLGDIGAIDHYEYRPIGDIVNTATRIESLNKHLGTQILVSEDVIRQLDGFLSRGLGRFLPAGKTKSLQIHELVCRREESSEQQTDGFAQFAGALAAFQTQSWEEAIEKFQKSAVRLGRDGPSHFFLKVIEQYKETPPGDSWDGAVPVKEK